MIIKFGENEICVIIKDPIIINTTYYKKFTITINDLTHEETLDYYQAKYEFVLLNGRLRYFLLPKKEYEEN